MESVVAERIRPAGWELRLAAAINGAHGRMFHPRTWNCATFSHVCAQAVRRDLIDYRWCGGLEESVDAVLGRVATKFAQRGDVVLASVPAPSLGVCLGADAVFVTHDGSLLSVPMERVSIAWAV